jgi:hypothetical protein
MSSSSIPIASARTVVDPVAIEDVGREIVRWGLIVVLAWIGAMKFTALRGDGHSAAGRAQSLRQLDVRTKSPILLGDARMYRKSQPPHCLACGTSHPSHRQPAASWR